MDNKTTVTEDIYDCLKKAGLEVYTPGQHTGECVSEYVVVQDAGDVNTTEMRVKTKTFNVMCYVPHGRYFDMERLCEKVLKAMRKLYPMMIETGNKTPVVFDDSVKGWTQSIEYANYRHIKYFE